MAKNCRQIYFKKMTHLSDNNIGYFKHLYRAWRWAAILIVHGIYPEIYKTTVSDEICKTKGK